MNICLAIFETIAIRSILIKKGIISKEDYEKILEETKKELSKKLEKGAELKALLFEEDKIDYIG